MQGSRKLLKTGWAKPLKPSLHLPLAVMFNSSLTWAPSQIPLYHSKHAQGFQHLKILDLVIFVLCWWFSKIWVGKCPPCPPSSAAPVLNIWIFTLCSRYKFDFIFQKFFKMQKNTSGWKSNIAYAEWYLVEFWGHFENK